MEILNYCIYIFNIESIISCFEKVKSEFNNSSMLESFDRIPLNFSPNVNCYTHDFTSESNENYISDIQLTPGIQEFLTLLINEDMSIYIIADISEDLLNIIILKFPFLLRSTIVLSRNNTRESYLKILKESSNKCELYDVIAFETASSRVLSKDIIYNCVVINNKYNNKDSKQIFYENVTTDFINIQTFILKEKCEFVPFYVSSKTKHRCKWIELKKYFPILARWTDNDKSKNNMNTADKRHICQVISEDISNCSFGILYLEKDDRNHIGSLIEMGLLLGQSKPIFICGQNIFEHEVLFNFDGLINNKYINNFNLFGVIRDIQYELNPFYIDFKKNLINILENCAE